jgi:hypothetical protein
MALLSYLIASSGSYCSILLFESYCSELAFQQANLIVVVEHQYHRIVIGQAYTASPVEGNVVL